MKRQLIYAVVASTTLLAGCATLSPDRGIGPVQALARERLGPGVTLPAVDTVQRSASRQQELLAAPLTPDSAVELALLNNPRVKASLAALGVADAERVQAGRLANPRYAFGNKRGGDLVTIDRTLTLNVLALFTWPLTQKVVAREYEAAQLRAATDIVEFAADVRRGWFEAVASEQSVTYAAQVAQAADVGGELARRMAEAGNFSALTQMREQAFAVDAATRLAQARLTATLDRERLVRLLGIAGPDQGLRLPDRLPDLPAAPIPAIDAERSALERRFDVQMAMRSAEAAAENLGISKATRFVNVLDLGYTNESNRGEPRLDGYQIELELPLFDWGDARLARAEADYMRRVAHAAGVALDARSELRTSYQTYRSAWDLARRYRDEVVPLRKRIADENLLRYNGMLISVFELLADAGKQIAAVSASIGASRDFWIAQTNLELAQSGAAPVSGEPDRLRVPPAALSGIDN